MRQLQIRGALIAFAFCVWFAPLVFTAPAPGALIEAVDSVGMTVSNMGRSIAFFSDVLTFEKVSDNEVAGSEYERLNGGDHRCGHGQGVCAAA